MKKNKFIFCADDFGKSEAANQNILKLLKLGKIQRVAILVNGKINKPEVRQLLASGAKLDLHLVLPGTDHKKEQKRVIRRTFLFLGRLIAGKTALSKVDKAWENQVEKFRKKFGRNPDGLNSHEHVHFFPPYFKIVLKKCEEHKISYIRVASEKVINNGNKIGRILKVLNKLNKNRGNGCDFVTSLDWIDNFEKFKNNLPPGSIEIVCHPERKKEYQILKNFSSPEP